MANTRQGWTNDERYWFHHTNQGTNTFGLPYEWFKALEQPQFSFSEVGLLSDQKYLSRFGFIPSTLSLREQKLAAEHSDAYQTPASKYSIKESILLDYQ